MEISLPTDGKVKGKVLAGMKQSQVKRALSSHVLEPSKMLPTVVISWNTIWKPQLWILLLKNYSFLLGLKYLPILAVSTTCPCGPAAGSLLPFPTVAFLIAVCCNRVKKLGELWKGRLTWHCWGLCAHCLLCCYWGPVLLFLSLKEAALDTLSHLLFNSSPLGL